MFSSALKKMAVGIALIGTIGAAHATPIIYDLQTLDETKASANIQIRSAFDDVFKFTASSSPSVLFSVVGGDLRGDLSAQYSFALGTAFPTSWTSLSSLAHISSDTSGLFSYTQTVDGLVAGETYWINVQGSATKAAYSVTLAPVPEPETYALLLTGLGLMGVVARRRKINTAVQGA